MKESDVVLCDAGVASRAKFLSEGEERIRVYFGVVMVDLCQSVDWSTRVGLYAEKYLNESGVVVEEVVVLLGWYVEEVGCCGCSGGDSDNDNGGV